MQIKIAHILIEKLHHDLIIIDFDVLKLVLSYPLYIRQFYH